MPQFQTVVIGNESLLVQCSEKVLAAGHGIGAVVTRNPEIANWARGKGLRCEAPGKDLAQRLSNLEFDWLLSIANLDIIPADVLTCARRGAVNFHDAPLPRHAGLNAPVWALLEGETRHGVTWHLIEGGVDEGDILVQRHFDISASDTALTLNTKCYEAAIDSFDDLVRAIEATDLPRAKQDLRQRSYHARDDRPFAQGLLEFSNSARSIETMVRALDHGTYWNPLTTPKVMVSGRLFAVGACQVVDREGPAGTVLVAEQGTLTIACADGAVALSDLQPLDGGVFDFSDLSAGHDVSCAPEIMSQLESESGALAKHDGFWRGQLSAYHPLKIAFDGVSENTPKSRTLDIGGGSAAMALICAALAAQAGNADFDVALTVETQDQLTDAAMPWVPLRIRVDQTLGGLQSALAAEVACLEQKGSFAKDLFLRAPELATFETPSVGFAMQEGAPHVAPLTFVVGEDRVRLSYDPGRVPETAVDVLIARIEGVAAEIAADLTLANLPALVGREREVVLNTWNATDSEFDNRPMHDLFEDQVSRTPEAIAVVFKEQALTYAELNARANRIAHVLQEMGVVPDTIVGLATRRSVDLLAGALGILKAGGAYLPLDPAYPADRLEHYISDSGCPVIVTQSTVLETLPENTAAVLTLDADPRLTTAAEGNPDAGARAENLAYMIYTSGSTGTPKGVMVEHRNAANFFRGMDERVAHEDRGTWLAVTSLSFDISVLELFYTTARGFKVVLPSDEDRGLISNGPLPTTGGGMDFSLYYWGNDDGVGPDKYKTLLEGAKFADDNGFVAVWTPERHFHAFGGPYPNPSVTGAAVAAVTKSIGVRAGSCVAPLHHPARIAEEWGVIDNLTGGRAGLAIASGWQPDDFVLRPENTPPENKPAMIESIETVRRLWRGEAVAFPRKDGSLHEVVTQPRPVSKELPIWVTTAGNPETWKEAGRLGANVLTHLLGQSIDEVAQKIGLYHAALRDAGHDPDNFTVTLMLHTFIAPTRDEAREIAREPMKDYLRSAAGLIKQYAWAFPAFKKPEGVKNPFELDLGSLSEDELEGILDFAFERYFNDSGLFGTVEDAMERVKQVRAIGVSEIACLIDYGIAADIVLDGLRPLADVVRASSTAPKLAEDDFSIAAQIVRHDVSHLQCTPSMARMFAMNVEARQALSRVRHLYFGGEPLPGSLVDEFSGLTTAPIENMYGPTETTIWSSTRTADGPAGVVDIGTPIANTQFYVLDDDRQPVAIGQEGELWIGGAGVTRGYWQRADLTAERFADNPFGAGRMYRTGDLVRRRLDGTIDFLGRVDHQIKLRGFRIELGEIEAVLEAQDGIAQGVVVAREDSPGDVRLVGYYTGAVSVDQAQLKAAMSERLPDYMVPGRFVHLEAFPLTPNKKVDRNALPAPVQSRPVAVSVPAPSATPAQSGDGAIERRIAAIWGTVLGVEGITGRDNFFDLGGHSLLAVQAHRAIREELQVPGLSITDIFRFPVLRQLAARVSEMALPVPTSDVQPIAEAPDTSRAQNRRDAMARRREMRARRRA